MKPWEATRYGRLGVLTDEAGKTVYTCPQNAYEKMKRVAACMNACQGIPDNLLSATQKLLEGIREALDLVQAASEFAPLFADPAKESQK